MKRAKVRIIATICVALAGNIAGETNYVSAAGSNDSPYTNWATAAHSIASAVAEASYGDTVLVTNGTYSISNTINIAKSIKLKSVNGADGTIIQGTGTERCLLTQLSSNVDGFTITNGFEPTSGGGVRMEGSSTLRNCIVTGCLSENKGGGIYMYYGGTVINCEVLSNTAGMEGGGINLYRGGLVQDSFIAGNTASNAAGGVYLQSGSGQGIGTVEGGIVSNNIALDITGTTSTYEGSGGGAFILQGGEIIDCTLTDNLASNYGGGVIIVGNGEVAECTIEGNEAKRGGGVYLYEGGLADSCTIESNRSWSTSSSYGSGGGAYIDLVGTVQDCRISGNTAPGRGGGAYTLVSTSKHNCKLIGNIFSGNTAEAGGGAYLNAYFGGTYIRNCLLTNNTATSMDVGFSTGGGGGLFAYTGGVVENCTIIDNVASNKGGGIKTYGSSGRNPYVFNAIIYSNNALSSANWSYSGTYFRHCCSTPLLAGSGNISDAPVLSPNGGLLAGSPCIDAGTNRTTVVDDIVHTFRPLDGDDNGTSAHDIGAYEFASEIADTDGDGMPDAGEIVAGTHPADSNSLFTITHWEADPDSGYELGWDSVKQRSYTLQATTNLVSGIWSNLADYTGTGSDITITNPATEPAAFFRLQVERMD